MDMESPSCRYGAPASLAFRLDKSHLKTEVNVRTRLSGRPNQVRCQARGSAGLSREQRRNLRKLANMGRGLAAPLAMFKPVIRLQLRGQDLASGHA